MERPLLSQLIKTHAVFSASYYLGEFDDIDKVIQMMRRKFPEAHYQTIRGLVLRVARARAAGHLINRGKAKLTSVRDVIPRFEGWAAVDPKFEHSTYHYDVVVELRTKGGRKSHFRTLRLGSEELLSKEQIRELAQIVFMEETHKREGLSPPSSQRFNRLVDIDVRLVWRT